MCSDDDVDLPLLQFPEGLSLLPSPPEPAEDVYDNGVVLESFREGMVVLLSQDRGRYQNGHLLAVHNGLKCRPDGHLRLSISHIATDESVHGFGLFHVRHHVLDSLQLVRRLLVLKGGLKFLKIAIPLGEAEPLEYLSCRIEIQEFPCHLLD